nr:ATP phosphoribosyltransferase regulatory subunit [Lichenibacterium sp. 6Y81]
MTTEGPGPARARAGAALLQHLVAAGYDPIDPPLLHDAGTFLDLGGEDIRARLYLTADAAGRELCLRPEFTIPAARAYLASAAAGRPAAYSYFGPVFRMRAGGPGELRQAGLESFGRTDLAAADAEVLALSLDAVERSGTRLETVSLGDAGLVAAVLDAVDLPPLWQRRVKRGLERGQGLDAALRGAPARRGEHSGLLAALAGADNKDAHALVTDLLSIAGITAVGGRSVGEIADRFLSQVAQGAAPDVGDERRQLLDAFFAVAGDPDRASGQLRALADDAGLDLGAALDLLDERIGFIAAQGVDLSRLGFSTAFARNLDYYTGFVFEAHGAHADGPVIGGGRYDRLCGALGSPAPIPAVGAAIWIDRLDSETEA